MVYPRKPPHSVPACTFLFGFCKLIVIRLQLCSSDRGSLRWCDKSFIFQAKNEEYKFLFALGGATGDLQRL